MKRGSGGKKGGMDLWAVILIVLTIVVCVAFIFILKDRFTLLFRR